MQRNEKPATNAEEDAPGRPDLVAALAEAMRPRPLLRGHTPPQPSLPDPGASSTVH